jgi:hypothetical protein
VDRFSKDVRASSSRACTYEAREEPSTISNECDAHGSSFLALSFSIIANSESSAKFQMFNPTLTLVYDEIGPHQRGFMAKGGARGGLDYTKRSQFAYLKGTRIHLGTVCVNTPIVQCQVESNDVQKYPRARVTGSPRGSGDTTTKSMSVTHNA